MVRKIVDSVFRDGKHYVKAAGVSTDTKPTDGLITGSYFVEVDTGKQFLYDEGTAEWYEAPSGYIVPSE